MIRKSRGIFLILLGLLLLVTASVLHILQERQDQLAGQNAAILLDELERDFTRDLPIVQPELQFHDKAAAEEKNEPVDLMPKTTYWGYSLVGRLSVPSVDIRLPVLSSWSNDLLNVAPCRYSGSAACGDLIILGHNYKTHLKSLAQVEPGAEVEFTAVDGNIYRYIVDVVDTIRDTDVEKLHSDHELNIFTCTRDRVHRIVVRCSIVPN